jgi:hypothetical protein
LQALAMMRDYRAEDMAFEFVDMALEERSRYRRLLVESRSSAANAEQAEEVRAEVQVPVGR